MDQAADICTKRFTDPATWLRLLTLSNVFTAAAWDSDFDIAYIEKVKTAGFPSKPGGVQSPYIRREGVTVESKFKKATKAQKGRPTSAQRHSGKVGAVASDSDACPVPECVALVENGQYVGPVDGYRPNWDHISHCHDQGGSKGNLPKRLVEYCCSPTS